MVDHLYSLIEVDEEKCLSCHACISACPVKYCNNGSGDAVKVSPDKCIGCGKCLTACTHEARFYHDDFKDLLEDLQKGENIIAIIAPSVAANFPHTQMNLNGWLKRLGIKAFFDVSFGAELTVKSYVNYIKDHDPELVISQACPVVVTYIEIYHPELKQYLAPIDSPMLHTMKMIKTYYPEFADHKVAAISPCLAKKREFLTTGYGDYNIGFTSIKSFLDQHDLDLKNFPEIAYANPPAERAVCFPSPGGLLKTAKRWVPTIEEQTRKIEGVSVLYDYLKALQCTLEDNINPLLIDCLNCEFGCNSGPLTLTRNLSPDVLESRIQKRLEKDIDTFSQVSLDHEEKLREYEKLLQKYWDSSLYQRHYHDLSENNDIAIPSESEKQEIFRKMYKFSEKDYYNCTSCGYFSCESMATAIYNGVNRPENCHFYLLKEAEYAHAEIIEREHQFSAILNTSVEGFIHVDNDFNILNVNPSICKMLNYSKNDLIGKNVADLTNAKGQEIIAHQRKLRELGKTSLYELVLQGNDDVSIKALMSASPLHDKDGDKTGSYAMVTDITEMKQVEEQLFQAQKMEMIGNLAGGLAHDFNNALSGIKGSVDMIERLVDSLDIPQKQLGIFLDLCGQGVSRAENIVKQLLSLSRKHELELAEVDLNKVIRNIIKMSNATFDKSIELIPKYHRRAAKVEGDITQLEQVILNLFINAMHAMTTMRAEGESYGGTLSVTIEEFFPDTAFVANHSSARHDHYWMITIADTGVGMSEETRAKIFNPFFTTKTATDGTGLGLTMVQNIIKQHHGLIDVDSEPGLGTCFRIYLPAYAADERETAVRARETRKYVKGEGLILIVEDDFIIRSISENILKELGYDVIVACNGQQGIDFYKENLNKISLVILDLILPKCSGKEVYSAIKEMNPNEKVLLTTGYRHDERVKELQSLGLDDIIQKPFSYPALSHKVAEMINT